MTAPVFKLAFGEEIYLSPPEHGTGYRVWRYFSNRWHVLEIVWFHGFAE